ncbi:hypothetical protein [Alteribacillus iranensis]|uniref:Uncharacterized protein n=1 Tax=Alteribacillus iranensis TaxID=930128 RepID=A0A1I2AD94_9BACI|nr:hypothetical protein [Alteribacillus iranensis]SFE41866.1 hypothetical protein SAMN05192532_101797 [Alteribacillus iranensis]
MKKLINGAIILFVILIVSGFLIPVQLTAPPDVRTIVDHTNQVYVTPPCFNEAELTNYLQETTYQEATELGYKPESSCTADSVVEEEVPINIALFKMMGLRETKWDDEAVWQ